MKAIFRRELLSYFTSPLGYVYLAVFYIFSGIFFYFTCLSAQTTDLSNVFYFIFIILILIMPILTMRILSEERKQKTDQLLLSSPVTLTGLVMGKFLAAFLVFSIGVAITFVYAIVLSAFGAVSWSVVIGNIVGLLLIGAAFVAMGIFVSSLTENQVIAAIITYAILLFILFIDSIASLVSTLGTTVSSFLENHDMGIISFIGTGFDWLGKALAAISIYSRYYDMCLGIIDFSSVLMLISFTAVFIFLTVRVLERRRWN